MISFIVPIDSWRYLILVWYNSEDISPYELNLFLKNKKTKKYKSNREIAIDNVKEKFIVNRPKVINKITNEEEHIRKNWLIPLTVLETNFVVIAIYLLELVITIFS